MKKVVAKKPAMKKPAVRKMQDGGKSKTVVTSPSGNYKTITKTESNPSKMSSSSSSSVRRTVKGVVGKAPSVEVATGRRKALGASAKEAYPAYYEKMTGDFKKGGKMTSARKKK